MVKRQYVCRNCRRFTSEKTCLICGSSDLSASWKGLVIIINPNESEIAKTIGIEAPGKYALYVG
jgi:DNA-directed RNA polymerase subunit E"